MSRGVPEKLYEKDLCGSRSGPKCDFVILMTFGR